MAPLIYALQGVSAPYERITAIEASTPTPAIGRKGDLDTDDERRSRNPHSLKGYDPVSIAHPTERKPVLHARDIMTKSIFKLQSSATLAEARDLMQSAHIRHIPILGIEGELAGILSDRDILRAGSELQLPVSTRMTSHVLAASPETPIQEIADAMLNHQIHAMPIINSNLLVTGMITSSDILRAIVNRAPLELWV